MLTLNEGWNPLLWSAISGETSPRSLAASVEKYQNELTEYRSSALHFAVLGGNNHTLQILLESGLDVNHQNLFFESPLHWACKEGSLAMVMLLLRSGASVDTVDEEGNTPLHWAAEYDRLELVQCLVENNASCKATNDFLQTPYDLAVFSESEAAARELKNHQKTTIRRHGENLLRVVRDGLNFKRRRARRSALTMD